MKRINVFTFVELGMSLEPLKSVKEGKKYAEVFIDLWITRNRLESLLTHDSLYLRTSIGPAQKLIQAITAIVPQDPSAANPSQIADQEIDQYLQWGVKRAAEEFQTVLAAELNVIDTYAVSQKGAYSTSDLVDNTEIVFPNAIRIKLPPQTLVDIRQAGRCLAFDTPTAAGFHITRAIESTIIAYYKHVLGTTTTPKLRNWGSYIQNLGKTKKADGRIIELLKHIKDSYRNPVAHPEVVLNSDEVVVLFGLAISAITQMALAMS